MVHSVRSPPIPVTLLITNASRRQLVCHWSMATNATVPSDALARTVRRVSNLQDNFHILSNSITYSLHRNTFAERRFADGTAFLSGGTLALSIRWRC